MAGLKEIKSRLRSVKNTKKITYAMKLVSAAKLRKVQEAVGQAREYTNQLFKILKDLSQEAEGGSAGFTHPLMVAREVKKVLFVVVGGQRGLCGSYNSTIHRKVLHEREKLLRENPGTEITAIILGKKPAELFRRLKIPFLTSYEDLPDSVALWPIEEISREIEKGYAAGDFDQVWLFATHFKSVISQAPVGESIVPIEANLVEAGAAKGSGDTESNSSAPGMILFEPSTQAVFSAMVPRVLRSKLRQACLDSKASETASRMTAMDAATKNANDLTRKLELKHNKLRQLRITSELLDILGGAEAVN